MHRKSTHAFSGASLLLDGSMLDQLRLTWRLLRDERVTGFKYLLPGLVALYVASPIDPIPDFLLGLGQMDDLGVVIAALVLMVRIIPRLAPAEIVREHMESMSGMAPPPSRTVDNQPRVVDAAYSVRGAGQAANRS